MKEYARNLLAILLLPFALILWGSFIAAICLVIVWQMDVIWWLSVGYVFLGFVVLSHPTENERRGE